MVTNSSERRKFHETDLRLQFSKGENNYSAPTNAGGTGRHLVSFMLRAEISTGALVPYIPTKPVVSSKERTKVVLMVLSRKP